MKVLKRSPRSKNSWSTTITCTGDRSDSMGCKSVLKVSESDIYKTYHVYYDGDRTEYNTVQCPLCKKESSVSNAPFMRYPSKKEWFAKKPSEQSGYEHAPSVSYREIPDFPKKGIMFKDISPVLANPKEFDALIKFLAKQWKGKVDKIGGFDARGFIFASALAYEMKIPFFMLRKKGKLPGLCKEVSYGLEYGEAVLEIQEDALKKKEKVLLIDDLLATGGTAKAGCELVESLGAVVAGVQFIIALNGLPGKEVLSPYNVHSLVWC